MSGALRVASKKLLGYLPRASLQAACVEYIYPAVVTAMLSALVLTSAILRADDRVRWYETRGITVDQRAQLDWSQTSYWNDKLLDQVQLVLFDGIPRDRTDRDALLATVSSWVSSTNLSDHSEAVLVLDRPRDSPQKIAARVDLEPASGKPRLELEPLLIDEQIAFDAKENSTNEWRPSYPFMHSRFPDGIKPYCDANAAICSMLFGRLGQLLQQPGSRLVTIARGAGRFTFHALILNGSDPAKRLTVRYLGSTGVTVLAAPASFETKDGIDLHLERSRGEGNNDALGEIRGIDDLSREERTAIKYAALSYFQSGTRNAEVDIAWPVGVVGKPMLYALRFLPGSNDVAVRALGEMPQPLRCDLRRTPGFPRNAAPVRTSEWLQHRYPAIRPQGQTSQQLIADAQRLIDAQAGSPNWFRDNYRLAILGPKEADRRLADTHGMPAQQRAGLKHFSAEELHTLECVLETMGDRLLQRVHESVLIRQSSAQVASPFGDLAQQVSIAGHTFTRTLTKSGPNPHREVHSTVVIYDAAVPPATRFVGGRDEDGRVFAYAPMAQVFAHEFGHVVASRASLGEQFYRWVAQYDMKPFTRYAASAPDTEFFPEAFSLYLLNPWWIQTNYPDLFGRAKAYASRPADH